MCLFSFSLVLKVFFNTLFFLVFKSVYILSKFCFEIVLNFVEIAVVFNYV